MYVEVATSLETRKLNKLFTYEVPTELELVISIGQNVLVPFGKSNKEISAIIIKILPSDYITQMELKKIIKLNSKKTDLDKKLLSLAVMIKDKYFLPLSSILKLMTIKNITVKENYNNKNILISDIGRERIATSRKSKKQELLKLIEKEGEILFLELIERGFKKTVIIELIKVGDLSFENKNLISNKVNLSPKQEIIYHEIQKGLIRDENSVYLLFGATGSGKTEIYFKAIEKTLLENKQVIVLLPEINLTEQMISRFEEAFPDNVVKWHSQITLQQKKKAWEDLVNKEKNILIGPRSAIFTKMSEVGLIIVDEEHDISYYQQNYPNYNGRDVAIMRGNIEKAVVVLGSATPSVDSMQMVNDGKFELLRLEEKYHGQTNPNVQLINMSEELHKGNSTIISDALDKGIREKIKKGEQILIFINRRGYYNFLMCRDCGNVIKCENCEIPLAYHEKDRKLICHYCDYKVNKYEECPTCGSKRIRGIGLGTEQAVEILKKKYPELEVERLDSDVKGGNTRKKIILQDFKDNKIQILVGTQIIAKGIDFPNVGLVGILLGDMSLNFPDFRAREWTFQLLMQVIGRTSRRDKKGEVILQTYHPSDIIYRDIQNFDYHNFYLQELKFRKKHRYPPFGEIVRLQFIGLNRDDLIELVWNSYNTLKTKFSEGDIFQPKPNRIEKFNNTFRWQIVIKFDKTLMIEKEKHLKDFMENYYMNNNKKEMVYIERNPYGLI
ncbi:MAG: primosomal protein N' (replication factor Y) (superfamily II helicase) [Fusobacteria bacterium]|nr:MAG: primosomal protein N' (replication factor Y) (superfamily II helicase) [Fusobacteriota bacterium]KAF0229910.1 MAG: primosomal protein N' (replication factor Y) [Fusobacteriota bacterium]